MIKINSKGMLLILSSPSGAGKTTIAKAIATRDKKTTLSISYTTRTKRQNETDGKEYHFATHNEFLNMVADDKFLEYAIIYDHLYGTPKKDILNHINNGIDVILDVDSQGAESITKALPQNTVKIFILPPSLQSLEHRLIGRSTESKDEVQRRLKDSIQEISHYKNYDFIVINDDLEKAIEEVYTILKSERLKRLRRIGLAEFIEKL